MVLSIDSCGCFFDTTIYAPRAKAHAPAHCFCINRGHTFPKHQSVAARLFYHRRIREHIVKQVITRLDALMYGVLGARLSIYKTSFGSDTKIFYSLQESSLVALFFNI